jgi:hypothetical protein
MLIKSETSKTSVRLYNRANELVREAQEIADEILKGTVDRHRVAILAKGYAELYSQIKENNAFSTNSQTNKT